jgi:hypothetical protein
MMLHESVETQRTDRSLNALDASSICRKLRLSTMISVKSTMFWMLRRIVLYKVTSEVMKA